MFKIEKNVPMPERRVSATRKYPFDVMNIGDSFLAPHHPSNSMTMARLRTGYKFATKKVEDGVRVWRVE